MPLTGTGVLDLASSQPCAKIGLSIHFVCSRVLHNLMHGLVCKQIVYLLFGIKVHRRMENKVCLACVGWRKAGQQASQQAGSKAHLFPSLSGWKGTASGQDCQGKGRLRPSKGKEGSFQWERPPRHYERKGKASCTHKRHLWHC